MRIRTFSLALCAAGWVGSLQAQDTRLVRESDPLTPDEERARLKVPEGFAIDWFASEPMIAKPINLAFDKKGRLWVSSTVEYPYAAARERWADDEGSRVRDSRDAIKILDDTDGDGRADQVIDFADGLNIPTGVLPWHRPEDAAGCIAWSIPNIWYFGDSDGDGKCDRREVLFGPLGFEKDTHGMCSSFRMGRDGWVYATHGFNNTSHFRVRPENLKGARPGDPGTVLDLHSGNVFRFRPDGSRVEIWSWGQVNPFGLAWDRRGNLYSADCHSAPIYQLLRGAHYPSFGKPHDGLGFAPVMCAHTHGSTGICGIVFLDDHRWGGEWNDRIFIGNVVTSRVNADRIEWRGSTPVAVEAPDLVVSDDPWFRPVDLQLGPDGALYVADFYNRIIGHYEVPLDHPGRDRERGRIWRIAKKEGAWTEAPEFEVPTVTPGNEADVLRHGTPFEKRAAAAFLQDQPRAEALPALLASLADTPDEDTHLRHAIRLAIREHLSLPGAFENFSRMPDAERSELASIVPAVPSAGASAFLLNRWEADVGLDGAEVASLLAHVGRFGDESATARAIALARERGASDFSRQVAWLAALHDGRLEREGVALTRELSDWAGGLARGYLAEAAEAGPGEWTAVPHPDFPQSESPWTLQPRPCADGIEAVVISSLRRGEKQAEQRTGILRSRSFAAPPELTLWICGHRGNPSAEPHHRNLVRLVKADTGQEIAHAFPPRNDTCQPVTWDLGAVSGTEVRLEIVDGDSGPSYAWLGVTRIEPGVANVESFDHDEKRENALRTLATVLQQTAPVDLRDQLAPWLPSRPAPPPIDVSPERRAELDRLIAARSRAFSVAVPDVEKGAALFKVHCAGCHQVGGEGGLTGPQLDGIGKRGIERLCEDILDPNRNVDSHFHLHSLTLKDGSTMGGFVRSETAQVIRLIDAAGQENPVSKSDIAETSVSPISLMPPAFADLLSEAEFRDLLGFLMGK